MRFGAASIGIGTFAAIRIALYFVYCIAFGIRLSAADATWEVLVSLVIGIPSVTVWVWRVKQRWPRVLACTLTSALVGFALAAFRMASAVVPFHTWLTAALLSALTWSISGLGGGFATTFVAGARIASPGGGADQGSARRT